MDEKMDTTTQAPNPADEARDQLENLFTYHRPCSWQQEHYKAVRTSALSLARTIELCCPPGPDRTEAVRKVREAVMTANAAIATGGQGWR